MSSLGQPEGELENLGEFIRQGSETSSSAGSTIYPPYATTAMLRRYIPEADPDHPRAKSLLKKLSKRSTMLRIQIGLTAFVAVLNTAIWVWATVTHDLDRRGVGTLFTGNCRKTTTINSATHLILNGLSSLFLGASNYCMQILVAPTRADLDLADTRGEWLEIGVQSFKNLKKLQRRKIVLWVTLGIISILLHLVWNSTLFASLPFTVFVGGLVTSDFKDASDHWNRSTTTGAVRPLNSTDQARIYGLQDRAKTFTRLDKLSCLKLYVNSLKTTSDVVIVAKNLTSAQNNGSSLIQGWINGLSSTQWEYANFWVCPANTHRYCTLERALSFADNWQISTWEAPKHQQATVDYCLIGEQADNDNRCGIHFSAPALGFVCICTIVGCILVVLVATTQESNVIATIGDAIATFLENPEKITPIDEEASDQPPQLRGSSAKNLLLTTSLSMVVAKSALWSPSPAIAWFHAVSRRGWIVTYTVFLIGLVPTVISLVVVLISLAGQGVPIDFAGLWQQGLGKVNGYALIQGPWHDGITLNNFVQQVLVTNGLQLLLSCAYMFLNNILSRQLVANEWVGLLNTEEKKSLRVSQPRGLQRSTYTLSMPFKYSIPIMILFIFSHWLVSQSIFVVQTTVYQSGGSKVLIPDKNGSRIGYSAMGIILVIVTVTVFAGGLLVHSALRKYRNVPTDLPCLATCSAAISAVCQPPEGDTEAYLFPLNMGVVNQVNHGGYTTVWLTISTYVDLEEPRNGSMVVRPLKQEMEPIHQSRYNVVLDARVLPRSSIHGQVWTLSSMKRRSKWAFISSYLSAIFSMKQQRTGRTWIRY